jgi:hypothetical protein
MEEERGCWNCLHHLGALQCAINEELECGDGEYELWESRSR